MGKKPLNQKELLRSKGYIPASEAATMVGTSVQTIYNWIEEKKVNGVLIGSHHYVERASIITYFKEQDPKAAVLLGLV